MVALSKAEAPTTSIGEFKIKLERAPLLKSLARLQSIVEKRNTIPILSHIKLEATGNTLTLSATDMDLAAVEKIAATVEKKGAVTVPAHTFYDIVRKFTENATVTLDVDSAKGQVKITGGNAKFSLSCLSAADFPVLSEGELPHNFNLSPKECINLIDKARFAMSTEETRYYLNGVYLHVGVASEFSGIKGQESLKAVATDGHRLARIEVPLPAGAKGMPGVIVPRKAVSELRKLIEESAETVQISLSESKIRFVCGSVTLVSKLIDGTFPDYERVIPTANSKLLELPAKVLAQAIDRVSTISTEKTRGIKFSLNKGNITLAASSPENGSAQEEVPANYAADLIEIGFNSRYMLEVLGQFEGETAQMLLSDGASPALLRDPADATALYVVMPMRI